MAGFMAADKTTSGSSLYCPDVLIDPLKLSTV